MRSTDARFLVDIASSVVFNLRPHSSDVLGLHL